MKTKLLLLSILFSICAKSELKQFPETKTGGVDGGGGKSVVCRNSDGSIKSAELLDLYEGRIFYKLNIPNSGIDSFILGQAKMETLAKGRSAQTATNFRSMFTGIFARKNILPTGVGLNPTEDSDHIITPRPPCYIEQLAIYKQDELFIDGDIWNALNETNKAALIVHETLYKFFRMFGETNSVRTRRHVAFVFSGIEPTPVWFPTNQQPSHYECATQQALNGSFSNQSQFMVFNDEQGDLRIAFGMLDGQIMLTTSSVFLEKNLPLESFLKMPNRVYWLNMFSHYDMLMPVALSFENRDGIASTEYVMKVGMKSTPYLPDNEFSCKFVK